MTDDEKRKMYSKCKKSELVEIIIMKERYCEHQVVGETRFIGFVTKASICPVCGGTGHVISGFYGDTRHVSTNGEKCRSCDGKGYLIIN